MTSLVIPGPCLEIMQLIANKRVNIFKISYLYTQLPENAKINLKDEDLEIF